MVIKELLVIHNQSDIFSLRLRNLYCDEYFFLNIKYYTIIFAIFSGIINNNIQVLNHLFDNL